KLGAEILKWEEFPDHERGAAERTLRQIIGDESIPRQENPRDDRGSAQNDNTTPANQEINYWMIKPDQKSIDRIALFSWQSSSDEVTHQDRRERHRKQRCRRHRISFRKGQRFKQPAFLCLQRENRHKRNRNNE